MFAKIIRVTKGCLWRFRSLIAKSLQRVELIWRSDERELMIFIDQKAPRGFESAGARQLLAYLKLFARMEYQVIFWSYEGNDDPKAVQELKKLGIQVLHRVPYIFGFEDWIGAFGKNLKVAFLSRPHVAVEFLNAIKRSSRTTIVYYGVDLHVERMILQNSWVPGSFTCESLELVKSMEELCWEGSDVILYPSIDEVQQLREKYPHRKFGILPIESRPDEEIEASLTPNCFTDRDGLLFVGGFSHLPNQDGVLWFLNEVYHLIEEKIPNLRVTIAGNAPTDKIKSKSSKQVVVTGTVSEEELHSLYNKAKVIVAPLRIGAGVKGKVVEALRMGVPIISTSIGIQGLPGYENAIAVADDPADFAKAVLDLLRDESLWRSRREAGLKYYRENFAESVVAPKVLALLEGES